MFRNYLLTAIRNFVGHKLYTIISVGGLTIGLICAIFVILFARDEFSYDKWIPDSENLYRVDATGHIPGRPPISGSLIIFPLPQAMLEQIPEVKARTRLVPQQMTVAIGDRQFIEHVDVVDPNFFQVIKLPLAAGDPATVFAQPESVVLSESTARKYFADVSGTVGKTIIISGKTCDARGLVCEAHEHPLIITGILRDLPHNTQLAADVVIPNTSGADPMTQAFKEVWTAPSGWGFVALASGADPQVVVSKMKSIIDQGLDPKKLMNLNLRGSDIMEPYLTRFYDDHLSGDDSFAGAGGMPLPTSRTTVYGFILIGALILLVACFNFTNLATARATLRAREISLRKVMGARRGQLIVQFLGEALLMALASLVLTLALIEPLLPAFDRFLNKPITFNYFADWPLLLTIVGIAIVAGLVSGVYPAIVLSNFRPAAVLRTNAAKQSGSGLLRATLVVAQFAVSIGLGIAALVVFAQISFARHIDLGFRKDGVIIIDGTDMSPSSRESFANALRANSQVSDVALSDAIPLSSWLESNVPVRSPDGSSNELMRVLSISPDFAHLYGIPLLAGRLLSASHGGDAFSAGGLYSNKPGNPFNAVINAAAARHFGYSAEEAIGKVFFVSNAPCTIVGVIADTKMGGAKSPTIGTIYIYIPGYLANFSVGVRAEHLADTLSFIDTTWHTFAPAVAIQRHFLDDDFDKAFLADERQGTIFTVFVGIAVFIACLGLFGLAAFTAERRTKEIGLRKVFGAKTRHIVLLLLWQFSIPVLAANVIAWPFAYYYLHRWLEGYAYRISLNPLYFVAAGAVALIIAWATIYVHAQRVARANPIDALRYE
jgi:putative ABC transport system permease protein